MTSVLPSRTTRPVSNYIRRDDAPDVVAQIELLPHGGVVVEIDVGDVVEAAPAELLEEPRLSYLAGTIQDEGLRYDSSFQAMSFSIITLSMLAPSIG